MDSRETKYKENAKKTTSRLEKNQELYEEINNASIDKFDVFSNATVIGDNETNQIDVEKIKKILDTKYNEAPKRQSIKIEEEIKITNDLEETKEYDINAIINKAKSEVTTSYEKERVKKPNTDQYEILKNLDLTPDSDLEEEDESEDIDENSITLTKDKPKELLDLINTIVINEKKLKDDNTEVALDLFEDLKAEDGEKTVEEEKLEMSEDKKNSDESEVVIEQINLSEEEDDKSFETKETKFKKSDFESLSDDDEEKSGIVLKIFIFLLIVGFVAGMYLFLTNFLNI